jgi:hypothetical protein
MPAYIICARKTTGVVYWLGRKANRKHWTRVRLFAQTYASLERAATAIRRNRLAYAWTDILARRRPNTPLPSSKPTAPSCGWQSTATC